MAHLENRIVGIVSLCFALIIIIEAFRLPIFFAKTLGPSLVLYISGALLLVFGGILALRPSTGGTIDEQLPDKKGQLINTGFMATAILMVTLLPYLGLLISTLLFSIALLSFINKRRILINIIVSINLAVLCSILFEKLLRIPFPGFSIW